MIRRPIGCTYNANLEGIPGTGIESPMTLSWARPWLWPFASAFACLSFSVQFARIRNRSCFRSRGLRGVDNHPVDLRFDGNPSHQNPLGNKPQKAAQLLPERVPGPGDSQPGVHGHRPRHGLDFFHAALPAGRRVVAVAAPDPRLLGIDETIGYRNVGDHHHQTAGR